MTLKISREDLPVIYHIGLKILFDGYLIAKAILNVKCMRISIFLFDGYLIMQKI